MPKNFNDPPVIFDVDLDGSIELDGSLKYLWEEDALVQSIKLWIASRKGDILRKPNSGGTVFPFLTKPLTEDSIDYLKMAIRDGISEDFVPELLITNLQVKPSSQNPQVVEIYMSVYCPALDTQASVDAKIRVKV